MLFCVSASSEGIYNPTSNFVNGGIGAGGFGFSDGINNGSGGGGGCSNGSTDLSTICGVLTFSAAGLL